MGFRYEIPQQQQITQFEIMDELTEFSLAGDHKTWWIPVGTPVRDYVMCLSFESVPI